MAQKKDKFKLDLETAENEFDRFCENQRIDIDVDELEPDDLKAYEQHKRKIIKAIRKGLLVINDENQAVLTTDVHTFVFKQPKGSALLAMDRAKKGEDMKSMYNLMADICQCAPAFFSKIDGVDVNVCLAITTLFLD